MRLRIWQWLLGLVAVSLVMWGLIGFIAWQYWILLTDSDLSHIEDQSHSPPD